MYVKNYFPFQRYNIYYKLKYNKVSFNKYINTLHLFRETLSLYVHIFTV